MDPALRRYLSVIVALLGGLTVATAWLLLEVTGSILTVVFVGVLSVLVVKGLFGYVSADVEMGPRA